MPEIMLRELEFEQKKAKITLISVLFQPFIHWSGHTDCLRALLTTEILPIFIIGNVRKRWIYLDRLKFAINFFSLHVLFTYVRSQRNSKLHFFFKLCAAKEVYHSCSRQHGGSLSGLRSVVETEMSTCTSYCSCTNTAHTFMNARYLVKNSKVFGQLLR